MSYLGSISRLFKYVNPEDGKKCFRNSVYLFQRHIPLSIEVELVVRIEVLVRKPQEKEPLARRRCASEVVITKLSAAEIEYECVHWIHLAQERCHFDLLIP